MQHILNIRGVKLLLPLILGAISSMIFPPYTDAGLGYISLVLFLSYLLVVVRTPRNSFVAAYLFGFSFFAAGFYWICNALLIGGENFLFLIPIVLFSIGLFFGLFWAIPALLAVKFQNLQSRVLVFSASYVFFEWVRSFIFTGFPWNLLGSALCFSPKMIVGASYVGTYGLSLFMLLGLCGFSVLFGSKKDRKFGLCLIGIISLFFVSLSFMVQENETNPRNKVRLVQPSIEQTMKWNPEIIENNFRAYIDLSKQNLSDDIKLVVWGETACPYYLDHDTQRLNELRQAIPHDGFLLTGLLRVAYESGTYIPYNSAFVIDDDGVIKDYYDKSHLVPFGEFIPFREYMPDFLKPIAHVIGELGRGEKYKNLMVSGLPKMGISICYESIFPSEVVNKKDKPEVLVVLANDGWYGNSSGPHQHLAAAQLRAVEEGVTVIRSANSGISAVIDYNGRILDKLALYKKGVLDVELPILYARDTFYGKFGNVVPFILLIFVLVFGIYKNSIKECQK